MKTFYTTILGVLAAGTTLVSANDPIDTSKFVNDDGHGAGHAAAMASVPMFHFGRPHGANPCYPEDAVVNGVQTNGNDPDLGNWGRMDDGCAYPGDWHGPMSPGNPFPVYFTIKQCSTNEYRVAYNIYFKHDSGHVSDWEGVIVTWKGDGSGQWWRDRILLGQHGKYVSKVWGEIQNTINGYDESLPVPAMETLMARAHRNDDLKDQAQKSRNHAKIYVGAFYHAIFDDRYTAIDTANPANKPAEFRSNDWYLLPWDTLVQPGSMIKRE
ncbi:MAG: hypothetical protein M1813_005925 [Trichoglossum hirsutum]|nr:MAG: hypothetical protein M1813_005925 [Trichoglossum hirsutum]